MNGNLPDAAIVRARELSHGMVEVADRGDVEGVLELDALRANLLRGFFTASRQVSEAERDLLADITQINAAVIHKLEILRGGTESKLALLGRGRRALAAYSDVRSGGG